MEAGSDHRPPYAGGKELSRAFELPILTSLLDGVANRQLHPGVGVVTREPLLCTVSDSSHKDISPKAQGTCNASIINSCMKSLLHEIVVWNSSVKYMLNERQHWTWVIFCLCSRRLSKEIVGVPLSLQIQFSSNHGSTTDLKALKCISLGQAKFFFTLFLMAQKL